jgi:hypothetical protein
LGLFLAKEPISPFRLEPASRLWLNETMEERSLYKRFLCQAINLGSVNRLPWPFLARLVLP